MLLYLQSDWKQSIFSAGGAVGALTTKHTKNLLSNIGDMKWIDKTVSMLSGRSSDLDDGNAGFTRQGCHPFYEDIIENCRPSIVCIGNMTILNANIANKIYFLVECLSKIPRK